jgi:hypothetical protein
MHIRLMFSSVSLTSLACFTHISATLCPSPFLIPQLMADSHSLPVFLKQDGVNRLAFVDHPILVASYAHLVTVTNITSHPLLDGGVIFLSRSPKSHNHGQSRRVGPDYTVPIAMIAIIAIWECRWVWSAEFCTAPSRRRLRLSQETEGWGGCRDQHSLHLCTSWRSVAGKSLTQWELKSLQNKVLHNLWHKLSIS